MPDKNKFLEREYSYPGEISGAFLLGLVESFGNSNLLNPQELNFDLYSVRPQNWYPYDYLMDALTLVQKLLPDSSSILFGAGVKFIETWYYQGPGKSSVFSGSEWIQVNDQTDGGYNSVVRGGAPSEIGWCKNIEVNEQEGYAFIENVMPLPPDYLAGVFYGGFLLFDDMVYFNTEIESITSDSSLNYPKTIIKLIFRPRNKAVSDQRLEELKNNEQSQCASLIEADEILWHYRHLSLLTEMREKYNQNITEILGKAFNNLRQSDEELLRSNHKLNLELML
ncbi:MAG: hypothetical protein ACSHW0_04210 [Thalassotalea sp.]